MAGALAHAHGRLPARAGWARPALLQGDATAALRHGAQALSGWSARQGLRDARLQASMQRVRAAALAAGGGAGQAAEARARREAAPAAARRTDAPDSATVTQPPYLDL